MKLTNITLFVLTAVATPFCVAQNYTVSFGALNIQVNSKSDNFSSNGPAFLTPQPANIQVGNASTLFFGLSRKINDSWDIELAGGVPPKHKVYGVGTLAPYGVIAEVKQFAPTVFLNYSFFSSASKLRPFVGIGANFTRFIDRNATAIGNIATGGPTRIELTDSFGLAGQIGVHYSINEKWVLNANVAAANVKSDMTSYTGSIERKTKIDFRPVVYVVSLGYRF